MTDDRVERVARALFGVRYPGLKWADVFDGRNAPGQGHLRLEAREFLAMLDAAFDEVALRAMAEIFAMLHREITKGE